MAAMDKTFTERKRIRNYFGRIGEAVTMPNLIELQVKSYLAFLQNDVLPSKREDIGLQAIFKSVFPIEDFSGKAQLEFFQYDFDHPKYDIEECRQRGMTYASPLKVVFRLIVWDLDEDTGSKSVRDIKEQEVYMGDMPLMTDKGTFIINGSERVVVSQMHRSPGVFFDHDRGKTHSSGKLLYAARVIPYRGSWLDFEFDGKDLLYVRIDRRRKLPVTTLLMALNGDEAEPLNFSRSQDIKISGGVTREDILSTFYGLVPYKAHEKGWSIPFEPNRWRGKRLQNSLVDARTNQVVADAQTKLTQRRIKALVEEGVKEILVSREDIIGHYLSRDLIDGTTGEVVAECGNEITEAILQKIEKLKVNEVSTLAIDHINVGAHLRNTLMSDRNKTREEALFDIYRVLRPGEPPTAEGALSLFRGLFFDIERYDLSSVGRVKMNARLNIDVDDSVRTLRKEDIIEIVRYLLELKDGRGEVDDIDNLANRRVRPVGELLENQYRLGLLRMERSIRERMGAVEIDTVMPHDLINAKPASTAIKEFFTSSQLSQFMDQYNPLSEITHKRRLSALGPGGLTRERAGFEVRDVHPTHYGRICPIETPEGPNIGLINSLATYARVNKYGFIETPYRKVYKGKVSDEVIYVTAMEEGRYTIAQANAKVNEKGELTEEYMPCRCKGELVLAHVNDIDLIDVSPKQIVSVAASLIPFLENDDANRALMGSNMQRQAVPLIKVDAPLVGTGMEGPVARDSGVVIVAKRDGIVDQVDAKRIVIRATNRASDSSSGVDIYNLLKFQRSNQNTCINQIPLVSVGDKIRAGDIIADGPCTDKGELALGRNVLVAFMAWQGYNYEDSIIISERVVRDDTFTSVHIERFDVMARDTKLGNEEITRDVPNVGEEALRHLDEAGIAYIGAEVKPGDILVGKVTPKGESPMTPEEKLLRAIFGEKAADVRDTSLRVPAGVSGVVVDAQVYTRRGVEKDERSLAIERIEIEKLAKDRDDERRILEDDYYSRLRERLVGQKVVSGPRGAKWLSKGATIDGASLEGLTRGQWRQIVVEDELTMKELERLGAQIDHDISNLQEHFEQKVAKLRRGDELPPGVLKMVKIYVAVKRKLQPGDKMAGRHGNKGVVSIIVPEEDMPHLEDGTPVDFILNPLGVPSRMNVGQILETHLGWAANGLGRRIDEALARYKLGEIPAEELRKVVLHSYMNKGDQQYISKMSDAEIEELSHNIRKGVPMATPVFDGASEEEIADALKAAQLDASGQVMLVDGRTGEPFDRKVTVGYIYMLKLHHLVDDKIHARSVGPYSLVTQQPLGGKAQFGGQRFGEMEVWALQAYGAAHTLQEMLTVKSDDVAGRTKVYEAIVRGDNDLEVGIPESFNVLMKELRSLGLNVELI